MAKNSFGNIADEFLNSSNTHVEKIHIKNNDDKTNRKTVYGRPKAKDIDGEEIKKLGVYITSKQFRLLNEYSFNNEIDKSEAVRHILNKFFENE